MAYPTLRQNEVLGMLYNAILAYRVNSQNIAGMYGKFCAESVQEMGLFGDTVLITETNCPNTYEFGFDAEAANLLAVDRPTEYNQQALVIDKFRQVRITTDDIFSARAWGSAESFALFNAVLLQWLNDAKRIHTTSIFNTYVGTHKGTGNGQSVTVLLPEQEYHYYDGTDATSADDDLEATARLEAEAIAKAVADVMVELQDINTINDLGYTRSYSPEDIRIIWNSDFVTKITKQDTAMIFNKAGLFDDAFAYTLPARYFGTPKNTAVNLSSSGVDLSSYYAAVETVITSKTNGAKHFFAGQKITVTDATEWNGADDKVPANEMYTVDPYCICKIVHKDSIPMLTSVTVGSSFYNARGLLTNNYYTFGYSTLDYRKGLPYIDVSVD